MTKLCCTSVKNVCEIGAVVRSASPEDFAKVQTQRRKWMEGVRDRGNLITVRWLGAAEALHNSVLRRLAFAIGAGAQTLVLAKDELRRNIFSLQCCGFTELTYEFWLQKGATATDLSTTRRTEVKLTALGC